MPSSANGKNPYRVGFSQEIAGTIRRLQRRASRQGRGKAFLAAIRQIAQRLQTSPWEFGEPLYRLPNLRMQIRSVIVRPVHVAFAISEDHPLVFIKAIKLLSESRG